ncbi:MAG: 2-phosphosulfolactate phosphatase [Bacillota bacterium]
MQITTVPTVAALEPKGLVGKVAVVIDVLRATSVMTTAIANGVQSIHPVLTPDDAKEMVNPWEQGSYILAGERQALPIPGFDLGNSPLECTPQSVMGKRMVMTTTNGTRTIRASAQAAQLFIGSLLNAPAVAEKVRTSGNDLVLVCSGTREEFDLSDAICGGAIASMICDAQPAQVDDLTLAMMRLYEAYHRDLLGLVSMSTHGQRLQQLGLDADLRYCLQVGVSDVVPVYRNGVITRS